MKQFTVSRIDNFEKYSVVVLRPQSNKDTIGFTAGQYATLSVNVDGHWTPTRCLSIASADNSTELEFGFRVTGKFTSDLSRVRPGDVVRMQGPFGNFVIPEESKDVFLIAGGIGITPFMSMLRSLQTEQLGKNLTLLYSCSNQQDIPYEQEIRKLARTNPSLRVFIFINGIPASTNQYIKGPITSEHLQKVVGNRISGSEFMICGPDGMMNGITNSLISIGATKDQITTESFAAGGEASSPVPGLSLNKLVYAFGIAAFVGLLGIIGIKDVGKTLANAQPTAPTTQQTEDSPTTNEDDAPAVTTPQTTPTKTVTPAPAPTQAPATNTNYQPRSRAS